MPDRDRSTIDVQDIVRYVELLLDGKCLSSKRLVNFHEIQLRELHSSFLQGLSCSRSRSDSHNFWITTRNAIRHQATQYLSLTPLGLSFRRDHQDCRPIYNS